MAELRAIHRDEQRVQIMAAAFAHAGLDQHPTELRHRLDDHRPRHDRVARKWSAKIRPTATRI